MKAARMNRRGLRTWGALAIVAASTGLFAPKATAQLITSELGHNEAFLMDMAEEEALALSAAPAELSHAADLYLLGAEGYERVRLGTNGFACMVLRSFSGAPGSRPGDGPEAKVPACFNRTASESLVEHAVLESRMHASGMDEKERTAEVLWRLASGELRPPGQGALAHMRSAGQTWTRGDAMPAMYVYSPFLDGEDIGSGGASVISAAGTPAAAVRVPMGPVAVEDPQARERDRTVGEAERAELLREARDGEARLFAAIAGLSDAQWTTRPGADDWSVAETLEHIAAAEQAMVGQVRMLLGRAAESGGDGGFRTTLPDVAARTTLLDRGTRFRTASVMVPNGRFGDPEGSLAAFRDARRGFESLIAELDDSARTIGVGHPAFTVQLDGYQYLLQATGHADRHLEQIEEILRMLESATTASSGS